MYCGILRKLPSGVLRRVFLYILTDVSEVATASVVRAVSPICRAAWRNIQEYSHVYARRRGFLDCDAM